MEALFAVSRVDLFSFPGVGPIKAATIIAAAAAVESDTKSHAAKIHLQIYLPIHSQKSKMGTD